MLDFREGARILRRDIGSPAGGYGENRWMTERERAHGREMLWALFVEGGETR